MIHQYCLQYHHTLPVTNHLHPCTMASGTLPQGYPRVTGPHHGRVPRSSLRWRVVNVAATLGPQLGEAWDNFSIMGDLAWFRQQLSRYSGIHHQKLWIVMAVYHPPNYHPAKDGFGKLFSSKSVVLRVYVSGRDDNMYHGNGQGPTPTSATQLSWIYISFYDIF